MEAFYHVGWAGVDAVSSSMEPNVEPSMPPATNSRIEPFQIDVPVAALDDLRRRLAGTRWPDEVPGSDWDYGTNLAYLQGLKWVAQAKERVR